MSKIRQEPPKWHEPPPSDLLILLQHTAPGHHMAWRYLANVQSWLKTAWDQQDAEWKRRHP